MPLKLTNVATTSIRSHCVYMNLFVSYVTAKLPTPDKKFCVEQMVYCSDETFQAVAKDVIFINCIFITNPHAPSSFPKATFNCTFVFQNAPNQCLINPSYVSEFCKDIVPSNVWWQVVVSHVLEQRFLESYESDKRLAAKGKRQVIFQRQRKLFAATTVVCGVELEIPTTFAGVLDKRSWHKQTDPSQIKGNLEVVSVPLALSSIMDMQQKITKLYSAVGAPRNTKNYGNSREECASGIHVHFSWTNPTITCVKLQQMLYWITNRRGGASYLREVGGKSSRAFMAYSPFIPGSDSKYNSFHIVSDNRIEMRWMNNSPNPAEAAKRIKIAALLFVEAYMNIEINFYVESLDKSLKFSYH